MTWWDDRASSEEGARVRFEHDTAVHQMQVLHDDGLYRHLRFKPPDSYVFGFDIITWPGHLAVAGDMGEWVFSRLTDMFEFFDKDTGINAHYWAEKLRASSDAAKVFSYDVFVVQVWQWLRDTVDMHPEVDEPALTAALREEVIDGYLSGPGAEHEAHDRLRSFDYQGLQISDSWEWDLRDWDSRYLWICWAIVHGIRQYRARPATPVAVG